MYTSTTTQINEFECVERIEDVTYTVEEVPPGDPLLTLKDVMAQDKMSRPWHYQEMAKGRFPHPIKVTPRSPRWYQTWVDKNIRARAVGL